MFVSLSNNTLCRMELCGTTSRDKLLTKKSSNYTINALKLTISTLFVQMVLRIPHSKRESSFCDFKLSAVFMRLVRAHTLKTIKAASIMIFTHDTFSMQMHLTNIMIIILRIKRKRSSVHFKTNLKGLFLFL